eukprot:s58_g19.t1
MVVLVRVLVRLLVVVVAAAAVFVYRSEERFKSASGQEKLVLTVPRVRNDFYSYAKTVGKSDPGGFTGAVRGVSIAALAAP